MKVLLLIAVFTLAAVLCFGVIQFGVGVDLTANHEIDIDNGGPSIDYDVLWGISPAFEYLIRKNNLLIGFGAEYQIQREVEFIDNNKKMGFIPLFASLRFQLFSTFVINPEVVGHIGYNFLTGDDDYLEHSGKKDLSGGIYWGAGTTFVIGDKYFLQAMYKNNYGKYDFADSDVEADITNTQINVSAGMRL